MTTWLEAQAAELAWWKDWRDGQLAAEIEQLEMASWMGLEVEDYEITTAGVIWDVGGGPISLLLKAVGWEQAVVIDPAPYPDWTSERYAHMGIEVQRMSAEDAFDSLVMRPDEVWIYNTLQHVEDPAYVVHEACKAAPVVRLFEWVEEPTNDCHLHTLHAADLERYAFDAGARVTGRSGELNGVKCYAGVFR
jgi:hypothetical protein